jgi:putative inorganic carbon (hco3(-)) transporter
MEKTKATFELNLSQVSNRNSISVFILLIILLGGFYFKENSTYFFLALLFVSVLYLCIYFETKIVWPFLAFIIPFSINVDIGNGSKILLPSEPIAALLALYSLVLILFGKIEKKYLYNKLTVLFLLYFTWIAITTFFSSDFSVSIKFIVVRATYFFSFYVGAIYFFSQQKKQKTLPFFFYVVGIALVGIIDLYNHSQFGFSKISSSFAPKPFYNDHTIFSACICMVLPFLIFSLDKSKLVTIFSFSEIPRRICLLFLLCVLFFTYCRAAWISLFISTIVGILAALGHISLKKIIWILGVITALVFFNLNAIISNFKENKNDSNAKNAGIEQQAKSITNITTDKSNAERLNRWSCALRMFADKPFVGFGAGTYQFEYLKYQQKNEMTQISVTSQNNIKHGKGGTAHNEFLLALSETGFLGAFLLLLIFTETLRQAIDNVRNSKVDKRLNVVLLVSFLSFFIHSFFNNFLDTDKAAFLAFFLMAFILHQSKRTEC